MLEESKLEKKHIGLWIWMEVILLEVFESLVRINILLYLHWDDKYKVYAY